MPQGIFKGIRIAGVAAAAPQRIVHNQDFVAQVGQEVVDRVVAVTGIQEYRRSPRRQTGGDLGFAAAEELLTKMNIDRNEIGAIIDVTEFPDYVAPSTAFILHSRLHLPQDCMAFDVNLGCTGYVYGIHIACSLLQAMSKKYVLLIVGDVPKNNQLEDRGNPDHTTLMMLGDAGTATLLEKADESCVIETDLYADGTDFGYIYTLGGARCVDVPDKVSRWEDGFDRSPYDPHMDGMGVFVFSTKVAPQLVKDFIAKRNETLDDYDEYYFHQANKMIVDRIAKILKLDASKVPMSLAKYGNTNCGTIPVTFVDNLGDLDDEQPRRVLLCGFGVGLSWGAVSLDIRPCDVYPMIFTDEYYAEGEVVPVE